MEVAPGTEPFVPALFASPWTQPDGKRGKGCSPLHLDMGMVEIFLRSAHTLFLSLYIYYKMEHPTLIWKVLLKAHDGEKIK